MFAGFDGEQVTFEFEPGQPIAFRPELSVCVAFNYEHRPHAFLASVISCQEFPPQRLHRLVLAICSEIVSEERRRAFRFPVPTDSGLTVSVRTHDGETWPAKAVNLSVTGILLEMPTSTESALQIGAKVEVGIAQGNYAVNLAGEVMRRDRQAYGLFFPECVVGDNFDPPPDLAAIVRSLERHVSRHIQTQDDAHPAT